MRPLTGAPYIAIHTTNCFVLIRFLYNRGRNEDILRKALQIVSYTNAPPERTTELSTHLLLLVSSIGRNIKFLIDRPDEEHFFRLHEQRVYYLRSSHHKLIYTTLPDFHHLLNYIPKHADSFHKCLISHLSLQQHADASGYEYWT